MVLRRNFNRMTGVKCVVFVVILTLLLSLIRGDAEVSCVLMGSCILPCSFQAGEGLVLHWIQVTTRNTPVHSHYKNQDQFAHQGQQFRSRTSLFKNQISRGNASLQLTGVKIQDEGRYQCYTSTITGKAEKSFIILKVDAPVHKVNIQQAENRITCSSEGIYPEPQLTWSTNPTSTLTFRDKTTVQQNKQQLYSVSSSLTVPDSVTDLVYSCTVSTRRNNRTTTLFKPTSVSGCSTKTTIPSTSIDTSLTDLIWRFNHSQIILNQPGAHVPYTVSEEWRQQVKSLSKSGSLTLRSLSSNQEGIYTCELSDDEETYVTNTNLQITEDCSTDITEAAGGVFGVIVILSGGLAAFCICKLGKSRNQTDQIIKLTKLK